MSASSHDLTDAAMSRKGIMTDEPPDPRDSQEYHSETETYRVEYAHGTDSPSTVLAEAVATMTGREPDQLDPLYEAVDPAALDALFRPTAKGGHRGDGEVSFVYHGYEVAVRSCGVIAVQSAGDLD